MKLRMRHARRVFIQIAAAFLLGVTADHGQSPSLRDAVPADPIDKILNAFQIHPLVALGEGGHGNEQFHRFRLALIRHPRFAATVNDIVVESGNAKYQAVMDRFVFGENVPYDVLRHAWQDTTQPSAIWDFPIYEEFFRTVREVNASLPPARRLRVLLGDPPVDWDSVHDLKDLDKFGDRNSYAIDVIRREVLDQDRRALIIYGDDHLARKNRALTGDDWSSGIVGQIEKAGLAQIFVIHSETRLDLATVQANVATWPAPSLAGLPETKLGAIDFEPSPRLRARRLAELFDAVLYLGPPSQITFAALSRALCQDAAYVEIRVRRLALLPGPPPQAPTGTPGPVERFKQECGLR
jgi:hypothetical protein